MSRSPLVICILEDYSVQQDHVRSPGILHNASNCHEQSVHGAQEYPENAIYKPALWNIVLLAAN